MSPFKPSYQSLFPPSGLGYEQAILDVAAVTYFLRDRIAEEIPALVAKLCPAAEDGMKQADKERAFATLDAELAELRAERDELIESLDAARSAATPNGVFA